MKKILNNLYENHEDIGDYLFPGIEINKNYLVNLHNNFKMSLLNDHKYSVIDISTSYHIKESVNYYGKYKFINAKLRNKYFGK